MLQWLSNVYRLGLKELSSLRADPALIFLIVYAFSIAVYAVATGAKLEVSNASVAYVDHGPIRTDRAHYRRDSAAGIQRTAGDCRRSRWTVPWTMAASSLFWCFRHRSRPMCWRADNPRCN